MSLLEFDQGSQKIYLDPTEIAEVLTMPRCPGWSLIVMKGRKEHSVIGEPAELFKIINESSKK